MSRIIRSTKMFYDSPHIIVDNYDNYVSKTILNIHVIDVQWFLLFAILITNNAGLASLRGGYPSG